MPAKKKPAAKRPKKTAVRKPTTGGDEALFGRVATILEQARTNVVRAVNSHMVLAYLADPARDRAGDPRRR